MVEEERRHQRPGFAARFPGEPNKSGGPTTTKHPAPMFPAVQSAASLSPTMPYCLCHRMAVPFVLPALVFSIHTPLNTVSPVQTGANGTNRVSRDFTDVASSAFVDVDLAVILFTNVVLLPSPAREGIIRFSWRSQRRHGLSCWVAAVSHASPGSWTLLRHKRWGPTHKGAHFGERDHPCILRKAPDHVVVPMAPDSLLWRPCCPALATSLDTSSPKCQPSPSPSPPPSTYSSQTTTIPGPRYHFSPRAQQRHPSNMGRSNNTKLIVSRPERALQRQTSRYHNIVTGRVLKINLPSLRYKARRLIVQQRSHRVRIPTPPTRPLTNAMGHTVWTHDTTKTRQTSGLAARTRKHTARRAAPYTVLSKAERAQCTHSHNSRTVNGVFKHLSVGPLAAANFKLDAPHPMDVTTMLASSSYHPSLSGAKKALIATMPALFPARTPPKYARSSQKPGKQAPKHMIPPSLASSSRSGTPFFPSESPAPSPPASPAPSISSLPSDFHGRSPSPSTSRSSSPFSTESVSRASSPSSRSSSTSRGGSPFSSLPSYSTSPATSPPASPAPSICSEEFDGEWPEPVTPGYPYHHHDAVFDATLAWFCDYPSVIQQALGDGFTETFLGRPVRYDYESGPRDIEFEEMVLDTIHREQRRRGRRAA
ncbi:hypothetical protein EVG20_g6956 [Dentipellis fragilis]|uniref:Uncharacterized protein n=1 Tax=Dentipellis fragilis TaxID=205917 RepID=A0A4Y9YGL8_9AGAM|nr:hypothetical protein EVG20_g6956 [Dentipellis fragilis]